MPTGRSVPGEIIRFKVDGLLPGAYVLHSSMSSMRSVEWQGRDYLDRGFDTTAGRDIEGVVITVANSFTRVRGSVRDAKGATATGGTVIAFPVDQRLWVDYGYRQGERSQSARCRPASTTLSLSTHHRRPAGFRRRSSRPLHQSRRE